MTEIIISEEFVQRAVIKWLSKNGWGHFEFDDLHTHGVDIKAKNVKYGRYFFIEAKGESAGKSRCETAFVYSLGQIITRMKDGGTTRNYYGLALPTKSANIALRRVPWQVACRLSLNIFAVDSKGAVNRFSWKDIKEKQSTKEKINKCSRTPCVNKKY